MKLVLTCPRWCGQFLKKEVIRLWYDVTESQTGWLSLETEKESSIAHLNVWSRVANTVFLELGIGNCVNLDAYFWLVEKIDWKSYVTDGQAVVVTAQASGEWFNSPRTLQSLWMKAIMKSLVTEWEKWQEDSNIEPLQVHVVVKWWLVQILLNTSGEQLWKRGYRHEIGDAPLKENLAVCLLYTIGRRWKEALLDPCCGSGTICIEAAMIALNKAPGMHRTFAFELFDWYDATHLKAVRSEALDKMYDGDASKYSITWSDNDAHMVDRANSNAVRAWVADYVHFEIKNVHDVKNHLWVICSNPPYGMRLDHDQEDAVFAIHKKLLTLISGEDTRWWVISGWKLMQGKWRMIRDSLELPFTKEVSRKPKSIMNWPVECSIWKRI